jgi:hypothetical protein
VDEMRTVKLKSFIDESSVNLKIKNNIRQWKEGKCWSWYCKNPIYFILLDKKGIAMHGYCFHMHDNLPETRRGQKWVYIRHGKLEVEKVKK